MMQDITYIIGDQELFKSDVELKTKTPSASEEEEDTEIDFLTLEQGCGSLNHEKMATQIYCKAPRIEIVPLYSVTKISEEMEKKVFQAHWIWEEEDTEKEDPEEVSGEESPKTTSLQDYFIKISPLYSERTQYFDALNKSPELSARSLARKLAIEMRLTRLPSEDTYAKIALNAYTSLKEKKFPKHLNRLIAVKYMDCVQKGEVENPNFLQQWNNFLDAFGVANKNASIPFWLDNKCGKNLEDPKKIKEDKKSYFGETLHSNIIAMQAHLLDSLIRLSPCPNLPFLEFLLSSLSDTIVNISPNMLRAAASVINPFTESHKKLNCILNLYDSLNRFKRNEELLSRIFRLSDTIIKSKNGASDKNKEREKYDQYKLLNLILKKIHLLFPEKENPREILRDYWQKLFPSEPTKSSKNLNCYVEDTNYMESIDFFEFFFKFYSRIFKSSKESINSFVPDNCSIMLLGYLFHKLVYELSTQEEKKLTLEEFADQLFEIIKVILQEKEGKAQQFLDSVNKGLVKLIDDMEAKRIKKGGAWGYEKIPWNEKEGEPKSYFDRNLKTIFENSAKTVCTTEICVRESLPRSTLDSIKSTYTWDTNIQGKLKTFFQKEFMLSQKIYHQEWLSYLEFVFSELKKADSAKQFSSFIKTLNKLTDHGLDTKRFRLIRKKITRLSAIKHLNEFTEKLDPNSKNLLKRVEIYLDALSHKSYLEFPKSLKEKLTPVLSQLSLSIRLISEKNKEDLEAGEMLVVEESEEEKALEIEEPETELEVDMASPSQRVITFLEAVSRVIGEQKPEHQKLIADTLFAIITEMLHLDKNEENTLEIGPLNSVQNILEALALNPELLLTFSDKEICKFLHNQKEEEEENFNHENLVRLLSAFKKTDPKNISMLLTVVDKLLRSHRAVFIEDIEKLLESAQSLQKEEKIISAISKGYSDLPYPPLKEVLDKCFTLSEEEKKLDSSEQAKVVIKKLNEWAQQVRLPCDREEENGFIDSDYGNIIESIQNANPDMPEFKKILENIKLGEKKIDLSSSLNAIIKEKNTTDLKGRINECKEKSSTTRPQELLFFVAELLYRLKGLEGGGGRSFELNTTQYIAALMMLTNSDKNIFSQISTGEGKTRIIMVVAAVQFLLGQKVSITSANAGLSLRDFLEYKDFFKGLGVKEEKCILLTADSSPEDYRNADICFGPIDVFPTLAFSEKPKLNETLILDEADIPLFKRGGVRYVIKQEGATEKIPTIRIKSTQEKAFYRKLKKLASLAPNDSNRPKYITALKNLIEGTLKERDLLKVIKSSQLAEQLKEDKDFVIRKVGETFIAVPVIDGIARGDVRFGSGLQECLHARLSLSNENLSPPLEIDLHSTTTTSMSAFLNPYFSGTNSRVLGLSGTIADTLDPIKIDPNVKDKMLFIKIPPHTVSKRKDLAPSIVKGKKKYKERLLTLVKESIKGGSPVLIFFKNDRASKKFQKILQGDIDLKNSLQYKVNRLDASTSDEELLEQVQKTIGSPNTITLATKRLGRGADISLKEKTGLKIFITYPPEEKRDLVQMQGRSARYGRPGETQLVLEENSLCKNLGLTKKLYKKLRSKGIALEQIIELYWLVSAQISHILETLRDYEGKMIQNLEITPSANISRANNQLETTILDMLSEEGSQKVIKGKTNASEENSIETRINEAFSAYAKSFYGKNSDAELSPAKPPAPEVSRYVTETQKEVSQYIQKISSNTNPASHSDPDKSKIDKDIWKMLCSWIRKITRKVRGDNQQKTKPVGVLKNLIKSMSKNLGSQKLSYKEASTEPDVTSSLTALWWRS